MRFLLDVCAASRTFQKALADDGHDVLSALDGHAQSADEDLLALAFREDRVLITKDKDLAGSSSCKDSHILAPSDSQDRA